MPVVQKIDTQKLVLSEQLVNKGSGNETLNGSDCRKAKLLVNW